MFRPFKGKSHLEITGGVSALPFLFQYGKKGIYFFIPLLVA